MAETFAKVNNTTLEVTTTRLVPKADLIAQKQQLQLRIYEMTAELNIINNKLKGLEVK